MYPIIGAEQVIPKAYSNGPDVAIPVSLLLDLHNTLPEGHQSRALIVDYIGAFASTNEKAHWTRAVVRKADGSLTFDEVLWDMAVYRGKQETRMKASEKAFAELRDQLELLDSFYETEKTLVSHGSPIGEPLLAMPEPSAALHHVREHSDALKVLVEDMRCGLANNVAGTTERAFLQRLDLESFDDKNEGIDCV